MRLKKIFVLILCCIILSGCWDKVEIDRRIFVSVIGVDLGEDSSKEDEAKEVKPNDPFQERVLEKKLNITYGFPDISELGPGKSGTAADQFINVDASSMEDGVLQATGKSSRSIHLGQTQLIIFSSDLLEKTEIFKEIMDYLERHPNLNKMMQVVVVEGKAEDYVKYQPLMEENIEYYLTGLMENSKRNATILPITLSEMITSLNQNGNAIVPKMSIEDKNNDVILSGVAVIKNFALKGYLTPVEVADVEIMRGKIKGGKRVIYRSGHPVDINIEDINKKFKVSGDKNKLKFNINIRLEGQLREYYKGIEVLSIKELNTLQQDFGESIEAECNIIAKMLQKEFAVDPIGFRDYLEQYKPSLWRQVEGNWEEVYKNADIDVNVDLKIRRIGVIR